MTAPLEPIERIRQALAAGPTEAEAKTKRPYGKYVALGLSKCYRCQQHKPLGDFYRNKTRSSGVNGICKACQNSTVSARVCKEKANAQSKMSRLKYPNRVRAGQALRHAVQQGRVMRWPVCAVPTCDRTNVQGHHADYSAPLLVTWLCPAHHKAAHMASTDEA